MKLYEYSGPVEVFGKCVEHIWRGSTYAVSEGKARSNLAYQYKQQTNRSARTQVKLPGKLVLVG